MFESIGSFFRALIYQPLFNLLFWLVAVLPGESLGLGIVALTVFVRLALVPSSAQSFRAQRELQALQPKVNELRETYKDNPDEMNKRMLALYQEHHVNPLGSCLPLLIQLPILIVLYQVFIAGTAGGGFELLYSFVPVPGALSTNFLGTDLHAPNIIFALAAGLFQFVQTRQMMARRQVSQPSGTPDAAQQATERMTYLMPLITVGIAWTLPSALSLYWVVSTVFGIAQQWWILRTHPEVATPHVAVTIRKPHQVVTAVDGQEPPKRRIRKKAKVQSRRTS